MKNRTTKKRKQLKSYYMGGGNLDTTGMTNKINQIIKHVDELKKMLPNQTQNKNVTNVAAQPIANNVAAQAKVEANNVAAQAKVEENRVSKVEENKYMSNRQKIIKQREENAKQRNLNATAKATENARQKNIQNSKKRLDVLHSEQKIEENARRKINMQKIQNAKTQKNKEKENKRKKNAEKAIEVNRLVNPEKYKKPKPGLLGATKMY